MNIADKISESELPSRVKTIIAKAAPSAESFADIAWLRRPIWPLQRPRGIGPVTMRALARALDDRNSWCMTDEQDVEIVEFSTRLANELSKRLASGLLWSVEPVIQRELRMLRADGVDLSASVSFDDRSVPDTLVLNVDGHEHCRWTVAYSVTRA